MKMICFWFLIVLAIELVREELSRRGSDWQYIFEMEHFPLRPTKPSLIEGRHPTVGHFEGKMFSSWACEPGCYSTKPVLKWITCPTADYLSSKMPNCQYSREVVGISFDQLEVEFYVQLTLYWVRGLPLICLWVPPTDILRRDCRFWFDAIYIGAAELNEKKTDWTIWVEK